MIQSDQLVKLIKNFVEQNSDKVVLQGNRLSVRKANGKRITFDVAQKSKTSNRSTGEFR